MKRVLILGAGAVGQVYGFHLQQAGFSVGVWVRARRVKEAREGFPLTQIQLGKPRRQAKFRPDFVASNVSELPPEIAAVWVCLATTSLEDSLIAELAAACPNATFVVLSPGHFVKQRMDALVGAKRALYGIIGMSSYHAPLEGSSQARELETAAGTAYFLATTVLSGESQRRALEMRDALRAGGVPVTLVPDASVELTLSSAVLMPNIACLELVGYDFARFRREQAELAAEATADSLRVACALTGATPPLFAPLLNPFVLRLGSQLAARFAPFDIEAFLRFHFTKVRAQTELLLETSVNEADARGLAVPALSRLCERFRALGDDVAPPKAN